MMGWLWRTIWKDVEGSGYGPFWSMPWFALKDWWKPQRTWEQEFAPGISRIPNRSTNHSIATFGFNELSSVTEPKRISLTIFRMWYVGTINDMKLTCTKMIFFPVASSSYRISRLIIVCYTDVLVNEQTHSASETWRVSVHICFFKKVWK
jgi:hypothetical protein